MADTILVPTTIINNSLSTAPDLEKGRRYHVRQRYIWLFDSQLSR